MRHLLLTAVILVLMVPSVGLADDDEAQKQIAMLSKHHREAVVKGDTKAMDSMLADDWVGINPRGVIESKTQQSKDMKDGNVDFEAIDPDEVKVRVYGDAAVVMGRYRVKLTSNGRKIEDVVRTTEVFVKQGEKWRCVSTQVTSIAPQPGEKR